MSQTARIRFRCGHVRQVPVPAVLDQADPYRQNLEASFCPACEAALERQRERRFVSCPE